MTSTEVSVADELRRLDHLLTTLDGIREEGAEVLATRAPEVSGWSVEQHLYHTALATDLALGNVRAAATGKGMLVREEGELGDWAAEVLGRDEQPRGVTEAPRMVRPGETVDPAFLAQEQAGNRRVLEELGELAEAIASSTSWVPHQDLGTLRAAHWLRFAALHARHHLAIVEDVRAAAGG